MGQATLTYKSAAKNTSALNAWFTYVAASAILLGFGGYTTKSLLAASRQPFRVLGSFYASGSAALHHLNPYAFYPLTWQFHPYDLKELQVIYDVNLSPPCMLPLFSALAHFPIHTLLPWWTAISVMLFVASAGIVLAEMKRKIQKRQIVWLLLSASVFDTILLCQDYSLLLLLATLAWLFTVRGNKLSAAVVIGILVAFKPNLGFWPILLLVSGRVKPAVLSLCTAGTLTVFPIFMYGPSIYHEWLHASSVVPHWIYTTDVSLAGIFTRLGSRAIGVALASLCAVMLLYLTRKLQPTEVQVAGIAICMGMVCAPLAWYQYCLFAAPFFVGLRHWTWVETTAAALLSVPVFFERWALAKGRLIQFLYGLPHYVGLWIMLGIFLYAAFEMRKSDERSAEISSEAMQLHVELVA
ncbi:MAG TPA: glycosyltransferase 87 family protein [Acidobacteriaceae bacterium]|nr:glycosyltransferase 87 family protein [Acidobacteriaceae bacterium]